MRVNLTKIFHFHWSLFNLFDGVSRRSVYFLVLCREAFCKRVFESAIAYRVNRA